MMEFTKQYPVIRYEDGRETPSMDEVLAECSLNVHINGRYSGISGGDALRQALYLRRHLLP